MTEEGYLETWTLFNNTKSILNFRWICTFGLWTIEDKYYGMMHSQRFGGPEFNGRTILGEL